MLVDRAEDTFVEYFSGWDEEFVREHLWNVMESEVPFIIMGQHLMQTAASIVESHEQYFRRAAIQVAC
jgi:hypothetical protein